MNLKLLCFFCCTATVYSKYDIEHSLLNVIPVLFQISGKPVFHSRTFFGGRNFSAQNVLFQQPIRLQFQQPIRLHKTGGKFRPFKIVREWKTGLISIMKVV